MYMNQLTIIGFEQRRGSALHAKRHDRHYALSRDQRVVEGRRWSMAKPHRMASSGDVRQTRRTLAKGSHLMVQGAVRSREYQRDGGLLMRVAALFLCFRPLCYVDDHGTTKKVMSFSPDEPGLRNDVFLACPDGYFTS
jgi:hypothetical protein